MGIVMTTIKKLFTLSVWLLILSFWVVTSSNKYILAKESDSRPTIKIYYVPFRVQTFVPITLDEIEEQSDLVIWIYDNDQLVGEIVSLLKGEKPSKKIQDVPVKHFNIRLKIENLKEGTVYFVDQGGIVQTNNGDRFLLNHAQIEQLEAKIMSLRGIVHKNIERLSNEGQAVRHERTQ